MENKMLFLIVILAIIATAEGNNNNNGTLSGTADTVTTTTATLPSTSVTTIECNPNNTNPNDTNSNLECDSVTTTTETPQNATDFVPTTTVPATNTSSNETQTAVKATVMSSTNTTEQQNEETTTTMSTLKNTTYVDTENDTTTIQPNTTSAAAANTTASTTTSITTTTTVATTTVTTTESTTMQPTTAKQNEVNNTTAATTQTIVEKVKQKWNTATGSLNFTKSTLNKTDVEELSPSELIDVIISYYKKANSTEIKIKIEDSRVGDLARVILNNNPALLESQIKDQFDSSQNSSLHGLFAALHWFHDMVLDDDGYFQNLAETFAPLSSSRNDEESESNATVTGFIEFILSQSNGSSLLTSLCKVAEAENIDENICPKEAPPTESPGTLPGPEKLESTWQGIIAKNYTFLTSAQLEELASVTPANMTTATIAYVNALTTNEVQSLVDQNITLYVSTKLRSADKTAEETIGKEAVDAFNGDRNKEDLFYVYLNFITNFVSNSDKFETFLKSYVESSSLARNAATCDTSTINADGIVCRCIKYEAINITLLLEAVCEELQGGSQCLDTITNSSDNPTPISQGLSTGAIIGIVLGSVFGFILILIIIFFVWKRCNKKKSKVNPQVDPDNTDVEMDDHGSSHGGGGRNSVNGHPASRNGTSSP